MTHGLWTNNLELLYKSLIKKKKKNVMYQGQCCGSKQDST